MTIQQQLGQRALDRAVSLQRPLSFIATRQAAFNGRETLTQAEAYQVAQRRDEFLQETRALLKR